MAENQLFPVPDEFQAQAWADNDTYLEMYQACA